MNTVVYRIFVVAFLLGIFIFIHTHEPADRFFSQDTAPQEHVLTEEYWESYIDEHGPEAAFVELSLATEDKSVTEAHAAAHDFGGALYDTVGIEGFAVCGVHFVGGCVHEMTMRIMMSEGGMGFSEIAEYCKEQHPDLYEYSSGCLHSLGHGLMSVAETNPIGLQSVLEACDTYADDGVADIETYRTWCHIGAFMEYNFCAATCAGMELARDLDVDNPYKPCDVISEHYKGICYRGLVSFWDTHYEHMELKERYAAIATLCREIPEAGYVVDCAGGTGSTMAHWDRDFNKDPEALCMEIFIDSEAQNNCVHTYKMTIASARL